MQNNNQLIRNYKTYLTEINMWYGTVLIYIPSIKYDIAIKKSLKLFNKYVEYRDYRIAYYANKYISIVESAYRNLIHLRDYEI